MALVSLAVSHFSTTLSPISTPDYISPSLCILSSCLCHLMESHPFRVASSSMVHQQRQLLAIGLSMCAGRWWIPSLTANLLNPLNVFSQKTVQLLFTVYLCALADFSYGSHKPSWYAIGFWPVWRYPLMAETFVDSEPSNFFALERSPVVCIQLVWDNSWWEYLVEEWNNCPSWRGSNHLRKSGVLVYDDK